MHRGPLHSVHFRFLFFVGELYIFLFKGSISAEFHGCNRQALNYETITMSQQKTRHTRRKRDRADETCRSAPCNVQECPKITTHAQSQTTRNNKLVVCVNVSWFVNHASFIVCQLSELEIALYLACMHALECTDDRAIVQLMPYRKASM